MTAPEDSDLRTLWLLGLVDDDFIREITEDAERIEAEALSLDGSIRRVAELTVAIDRLMDRPLPRFARRH